MPIWAYSTSDGRVEEHDHATHIEDRVVAALGPFPALSLSIHLADAGEAHASRFNSGHHSCPGRCS
jgi:hypothetical protein